jgi:predicted nucleic acid-binding protein
MGHSVLDAFVLLAATDEGTAEHRDALTIMNGWAAGDTTLYTSGQILREYLAVATRPANTPRCERDPVGRLASATVADGS